jgi:hypothetical protein
MEDIWGISREDRQRENKRRIRGLECKKIRIIGCEEAGMRIGGLECRKIRMIGCKEAGMRIGGLECRKIRISE